MWFVKTPCNALRHYYLKRLERRYDRKQPTGGRYLGNMPNIAFTDLRGCGFIQKT